jgi:N6-adenosine-specific RNA methylase IME4
MGESTGGARVIHDRLPLGLLYHCIVVDPPWSFGDKLPGPGRGAAKHYRTLAVEQIAKLDPGRFADENSHLWLWTTNSHMTEAHQLMRCWGFEYKTMLTWCKPQIGMGHYLRNTTEHALFGVRGKLPPLERNVPSHILAPRSKHSRKPDAAYELIRRVSPEPRIDLFAREEREGFDVWGNEV